VQREAELAPAFIRTQLLGTGYGTLSSAIVRIGPGGQARFNEWTWQHGEALTLQSQRQMSLNAMDPSQRQ